MKQFLYIIIFLFGSSLLAQNQTLYSINNVKEMPVFPTCESVKPKNKKKMTECISAQLTVLLSQKLKGFENTMYESGISETSAILQFIISKEGIILDVRETAGSDELLGNAAVHALNLISEELPPIRPAKLKNGESVNMTYQFPLKYRINLDSTAFEKITYPVDEIVLFTLLEPELRYEIRLFKEKSVKVYEMKDERETYLGRFLSLNELGKSEPYRGLIAEAKKDDLTFITDGDLNGEFYEVYIRNLFDKDKAAFIEVLKVNDGERVEIKAFDKESDFSKSEYAPLIYR